MDRLNTDIPVLVWDDNEWQVEAWDDFEKHFKHLMLWCNSTGLWVCDSNNMGTFKMNASTGIFSAYDTKQLLDRILPQDIKNTFRVLITEGHERVIVIHNSNHISDSEYYKIRRAS